MAKLGGTALLQFCIAMTGTDHECYTEVQLEELRSLLTKYFLLAWRQLAEAYPQCFSREVYRLLVPEVVDAIARLDTAIAVRLANSGSWRAFWASLVLEAERVLVDDRVAGAQHKQIAVKRHVAAKYHELKGASENKRSVGQSEATVATSATPAPAEVGSELVQQTVAASGTSLDGLVSLRQLWEERWAPWSEDEKARVKSGSCPRGTIHQPEGNSRRSSTRSP